MASTGLTSRATDLWSTGVGSSLGVGRLWLRRVVPVQDECNRRRLLLENGIQQKPLAIIRHRVAVQRDSLHRSELCPKQRNRCDSMHGAPVINGRDRHRHQLSFEREIEQLAPVGTPSRLHPAVG